MRWPTDYSPVTSMIPWNNCGKRMVPVASADSTACYVADMAELPVFCFVRDLCIRWCVLLTLRPYVEQ